MTDFTCRVQPYLTQKQIGYTRHAEFRLTKNVHLYAGNLIRACSGHYKHITWVVGFVFLYSFAPLLSCNNKQRDALTTVQNSGKFSPIHNISINAIPICEKGNSDFARIMLLYGSEKHMNQRKECLT